MPGKTCGPLNKWIAFGRMEGIALYAASLAGIGVGCVIGWAVGAARARARGDVALRAAEGEARAAAATAAELRLAGDGWRERAFATELDVRRLESERDRKSVV